MSLKVNVSTRIPSKSSGRLLDALTDILRPITEYAGLKADLIRLQRAEVALQVAELAAKRVAARNNPIFPIPTKTVVRLLESASLEDPKDGVMINLWANLLSSATLREDNSKPRYISILSDINGRQAALIQKIMTGGREKVSIRGEFLKDHIWNLDREGVMMYLKQKIKKPTPRRIFHRTWEHIGSFGIYIDTIVVNKGIEQWDSVGEGAIDSSLKSDLEILESLNLLKDITFKDAPFFEYELSIFGYKVTNLCIDLFASCNPDLVVSE